MNEPLRPSGPRPPATTHPRAGAAPGRKDGRLPVAPGFRERLHALAPAIHPDPKPRVGLPEVAGGVARPSPRAPTARELETAARSARLDATEPTRRETPTLEPELVPFRVGPSILSAPIARAVVEPTVIDPSQLGAELLESMRLGRFGRDGHAVTMRVRGSRGSIDVDLREEDGRLALRVSGDDLECARLAERVRGDLAERGIEIDVV